MPTPTQGARSTRRSLTVTGLVLCVFMSALEATVVATAMPTVIAELGGMALYGWVTAGYLLASTISVPLYGKLADLRGRKPWLLVGLALFLAGSMASGLSQSIGTLVLFRVLQGLGAGAMGPLSLTIASDIYSLSERGLIQGLFSAVWGISALIGPLLGGAIVRALSWRWVFYINVPLGLLAAVILVIGFIEDVKPRLARIDWAGAGTLTLASLLALGSGYGGRGVLLLPAALAMAALFVLTEKRVAEPLLPLSLFRDRLFWVASLLTIVLGGVMMGTVTYLPLFVQGVLGGTPTRAGASISPMLVGWPIASATVGRVLARTGFRGPVRLGVVCTAIASVGLAWQIAPHASAIWLGFFTGILGVGMGLAVTSLLIAVQTSVTWERRGVATASSLFFRTMGGALWVGALGSVLAMHLAQSFPPDVVGRLLGRAHGDGTSGIEDVALREGLATGLRLLFQLMAGGAVFALGVSLLFPRTDAASLPGAGVASPSAGEATSQAR